MYHTKLCFSSKESVHDDVYLKLAINAERQVLASVKSLDENSGENEEAEKLQEAVR